MFFKKKKKELPTRPLGIYVHIPFCVKKCGYCDFLSAPGTPEEEERYITALCKEIRDMGQYTSDYLVKTIYFGGGTPSVLETPLTEKVMETIRQTFTLDENAEITIEVNPGTITREKLYKYKEFGFNRLSMGIQSADDAELKKIGRIHTFKETVDGFNIAREVGFNNISVDVISALPGQTESSYANTLNEIVKLGPDHISSYSLILEEGTPFYEKYAENGPFKDEIPGEETDRKMYAYTKEFLKSKGYERYEISNYAKPGFESRHNSSYWTGTEYLGFGLGASSLFTNARYHNVENMEEYITKALAGEDTRADIERLVEAEQMEEYMILGLRMMKGISKEAFKARFGKPIEVVYGDKLAKLKRDGLITNEGDTVALTDLGIDVSNRVFVEFVPDEFVRR
ncbi:MAG: radical SAM family heme chaperone HemW [Lachnospiraceae bacterium]|nr:radical SAM family heme chaperone HemW [Lachnospiraceae bacterium]